MTDCSAILQDYIRIKDSEYKILNNQEYCVVYDTKKRIPLLTLEELVPAELSKSYRFKFRTDYRVENPVHSSEYTNTGYDRGHLAASANNNIPSHIIETYYMTNIAPQVPSFNQKPWKELESDIRESVRKKSKSSIVMTGVGFKDCSNYNTISTDIAVPDYFYKIVMTSTETKYYLGENTVYYNSNYSSFSTTKYKINSYVCNIEIL